jgi:hypothetical protein
LEFPVSGLAGQHCNQRSAFGTFALPTPGLREPNLAILHFPFVWLPACVVPLVLLAHLTAIRALLTKKPVQVK